MVNLDNNIIYGGWMQSLEHQISKDENIQLYIATRYNGKHLCKIVRQRTSYYLVPDKRNLLRKRIDIFLNREPIEEMLQQYLQVIDDIRPDIIHIFGTEMEYGLVGGLTTLPVVIHIQGILHACYYQLAKIHIPFCKRISTQNIIDYIKGNTLKNSLSIFKRRTAQNEAKIFQSCRCFIGRTNWDKKITNMFAPNASYFHGDEILRQDFYNAQWKGNSGETKVIVSTISNPLYKGHETVIATCWVLKKLGVKFIWHIIGVNAEAVSYRLFYKSNMKQLAGNIQLPGELKPKEMISILQSANVYVHPSHIENSSNSICEAMTLGMPVIALQVGGNASMITHGVDGLLVPDNDPYSLAATILEVSSNQEKYRKMAGNAKVKAMARHNPEQIVKALKEIYTRVVESHAAKK